MKFLGLSGHETNLVPLMMTFNLLNIDCTWKRFQGDFSDSKCLESPSFAANIIFELIKREGKYFVRGLYNGNNFEICTGFNTNTDYRCPIDTFENELQTRHMFTEVDYSDFCFGAKAGRTSVIIVLGLLFIAMLTAVGVSQLYRIAKNPESDKYNESARIT